MRLEFVDRKIELAALLRLIRAESESSRSRVIVVDSPAGMGKTEFILEACRQLVRDDHQNGVEWRIVRLDFRRHFSAQDGNPDDEPYRNKEDVIEEIARQLCRDARWKDICTRLGAASLDDQAWIQLREAALIPMENEVRQALLDAVGDIPAPTRPEINGIIVEAFRDVDIRQAQRRGNLRSVMGLIGFILDRRRQSTPPRIPDHVLLILDSVDAINDDDGLRSWVITELAPGLSTHAGLQNEFKRFAVIVSGRFVEQALPPAKRGREFQEIVLESFADKTPSVEDLINHFDDPALRRQTGTVRRLARKLCQICGGHPGVIKAMTFELYNRPGHFAALDLNPEGVNYWYDAPGLRDTLSEYRDTAISEILEGVSREEQDVLKLLSIFRKFNRVTLQFLARKMQTERPQEYHRLLAGDLKELYQKLKDTRLIGNDQATGPFDSDRFSLNLLSAKIREEEAELFEQLHQWATELFAHWVRGQYSDDPDAPLEPHPPHQSDIAREWLFHRLHLAECCSDLRNADSLGQQISQELEDQVLQYIEDRPLESAADRRRRIKAHIESDPQIDHLIWETAFENEARHDTIREKILWAFENDVEEKR